MTRNRWDESADARSGFDVHDATIHDAPDTRTPHLAALVRDTAELAQREQAALIERHRKARERYEAGVAERAGAYIRHLMAERWSA